MHNKKDDLFETQEPYKFDEIEEHIKFHPSKAEVEIGNVYWAVAEEFVNE